MRFLFISLVALALSGCDSFVTAPDDFAGGNVAGTLPTLRLINQTSVAMTVYFSPCSQTDFGSARGTIDAYRERSWSLAAGCWDVHVVMPFYSFADSRVTLVTNQEYTINYSP